MTPGLLIGWSRTRPASRLLPIDGELELGPANLDDDGHARVAWRDGRFAIVNLSSHEHTLVDGQRVERAEAAPGSLLRVGQTLGVLLRDIRPYEAAGGVVRRGPMFVGRASHVAHAALAEAARAKSHLVVYGEMGGGRGHVATTYAAQLAPLRVHLQEDPLFDDQHVEPFIDTVATSPDLRVVFTRCDFLSPQLPATIEDFLRHHAIRIKLATLRERIDEVGAIIAETAARADAQRACHVSVLEYILMVGTYHLGTILPAITDAARTYGGELIESDDFLRAFR